MDILTAVDSLKISEWQFKNDDSKERHIGPMAEDFEEVFKLGTDGKTIGMTDVNGIALASIQALNKKLSAKDTEIKALNERLAKLEKLLNQ